MKVLVACEFSGIVREAFRNKGHDAWSCDLIPSEIEGQHIQGNVLDILDKGWDLMVAHPPCTYLSSAGLHWNNKRVGRQALTIDGFEFFMSLYNAPIPQICVENPVGYINTHFRKADQIINPYQFGHSERKRTCLWLRGLPLLKPTDEVLPPPPTYIGKSGRKIYFVAAHSPSPHRWKDRSRTFNGVAQAMAEQWGGVN